MVGGGTASSGALPTRARGFLEVGVAPIIVVGIPVVARGDVEQELVR